jgi:7-cyano-7-deazaguanine synthase in queuosine biosynthesis
MKVLCTLSGGSDSAFAALTARQHWPDAEFHSLFVNYGQPELEPELQASVKVHNKLGFKPQNWHDTRVWGLYQFHRKLGDQMSLYVPHRNLVIASIAAAMAEDLKAEKIVVGNKSKKKTEGDPLTYDGNLEFYKALEYVVRVAEVTEHRIEIVPTLAEFHVRKLTRRDVYAGLWAAGFAYDDTFSCWFGYDGVECGMCKNCVEKRALWEEWYKTGLMDVAPTN